MSVSECTSVCVYRFSRSKVVNRTTREVDFLNTRAYKNEGNEGQRIIKKSVYWN